MARLLDPDECRALVASDRWQQRVTVNDEGCWLLGYAVDPDGYVKVQGRFAHRLALAAHLGRDIGPGLTVGHVCHDLAFAAGSCASTTERPCLHRRCVNPEHLAEQTMRENLLAGGTVNRRNALQTTCSRGHSIMQEDAATMLLPSSEGRRRCRTCHQIVRREKRERFRSIARTLGISWQRYRVIFGESNAAGNLILARLEAGETPEAILGGRWNRVGGTPLGSEIIEIQAHRAGLAIMLAPLLRARGWEGGRTCGHVSTGLCGWGRGQCEVAAA